MNDQQRDLARIATQIAPVFKEMGWRWRSNDSNRTMYVPNSAGIALTLNRMIKDLRDDPAVISSSSGRLTVERDSVFRDHFEISVEFGAIDIEKEPDDGEAT